jgi:hypothetical protein
MNRIISKSLYAIAEFFIRWANWHAKEETLYVVSNPPMNTHQLVMAIMDMTKKENRTYN